MCHLGSGSQWLRSAVTAIRQYPGIGETSHDAMPGWGRMGGENLQNSSNQQRDLEFGVRSMNRIYPLDLTHPAFFMMLAILSYTCCHVGLFFSD